MCEMGIKVAEGLLRQETSTDRVHCWQSGATVDLLPTYAWRQEAGATLDWPFSCSSSGGGGSISVGAT